MEMKIPAIAITAVVAIIVLAGVLMPVLDDAASDESINNSALGDVYFKEIGQSETPSSITLISDGQHRTLISNVEGVEKTYEFDGVDSNSVPGAYSIAVSDGASCRLMGQTIKMDNGVTYSGVYVKITYNFNNTPGIIEVRWGDSENSTQRYTTPFTWAYLPADDGDMVLVDGRAVITESSKIAYAEYDVDYPGGVKTRLTYSWNSTIDEFDGVFHTSSGTYTVTSAPACITAPYKWGGLELSAVEFTVEVAANDGIWIEEHSESVYLVPASVPAIHPLTDYKPLIFVIPIMVVLALLIAVVAVIFRSRQF